MALGFLLFAGSLVLATQSPDLSDVLSRVDVAPPPIPEGQPWNSAQHRQSIMAQANGREAELAGNLQLAFEAYREAVEADPGNEAAWLGLTRVGRRVGDAALVREAWGHRLALCPDDPAAIGFAAAHAMQAGRHDEALPLLLRRHHADRDDTRLQSARWNAALGVQLRRAGESQAAATLLRDARETSLELAVASPGDQIRRRRWASFLQQLTNEGSKPLARELAAARLNGGMLTNRGDRGRFTSTCVALDAVAEDAEATARLIRSLPQSDLRLRTHFREALSPAEMWTHASTIHATLGNMDGAIMLLEEAIRLDEDLPLALNNLGYMLLDREVDQPRAAALIEAAWALDPESAANLDSLGWLRVKEGRLEDDDLGRGALSLLREAARIADQMDPVILEHLGEAEAAAGQIEAARRTWRHALSLLSHPRFVADHVRVYDLVQNGDWGIHLMPSRDLYDLEFGGTAQRLRSRIDSGEDGVN